MNGGLILSLFPGIDALGLAFERVFPEACVVRGPDVIYGKLHDVRAFHPPPGAFWGIVGGPPCQFWSRLRALNPHAGAKHGNLIPEFERICTEAQPAWFLMENVPQAPPPEVPGYVVRAVVLNNRWVPSEAGGLVGAEQHRERRFSFGTRAGLALSVEVAPLEAPLREYAVTSSAAQEPVRLIRDGKGGHRVKTALRRAPSLLAGHSAVQAEPGEQRTVGAMAMVPGADGAGHSNFPDSPRYSLAQMCALQGLPEDFAEEVPFTEHGKRKVIGNAVPLPLGLAIARAVRRALQEPEPC